MGNKNEYQYGSDIIVDLLDKQGIEYIAFNPGSTIKGIQDSIVNYKGNVSPKLILCCHEEIAVAIAHGYTKASGKYMGVLTHGNVGLMHASMAIFNAWCDRVPMLIMGGVGPLDSDKRRPWIDWLHTSNVQGNIVKDFVKWHDQPYSILGCIASINRACKITNTSPKAPTYISIDTSIQEDEVFGDFELPDVTQYAAPKTPLARQADIKQIATCMLKAKFPVVFADYFGKDDKSVALLVQFSELLGIAVIDCGGEI